MAARVLKLVHRDDGPESVLLPGAGGGLGPYVRLAPRLGETHGVHLIPAAGLLAGETPDMTVEAMAAAAQRALDAATIEAAVVLGWSLGGAIGWELCVRLARTGRRPDLVLIDSSPFPGTAEPGLRERVVAMLGREATPEVRAAVRTTLDAQLAAAALYEARAPYPGRVLLMLCEGERGVARGAAEDRWRELAPRLTCVRLAAGHYEVFDPAHLPALMSHVHDFLGAGVTA